MKYQFCIRFDNVDINSAGSKAVLDCNRIFQEYNYRDYTFTVGDNKEKLRYYYSLFRQLLQFFFSIKKKSLVGIQYPLLSINNVFKYFIKLARFKDIKFFCVVHDLESLRTGGLDQALIKKEVENLNCYDSIIVHNAYMERWLKEAGVTTHMVQLHLFDYLANSEVAVRHAGDAIVFAGNLVKSSFVNSLGNIPNTKFHLYGPGYDDSLYTENTRWQGQYHPDEITSKLDGSYGLIWDGTTTDTCGGPLGNYLRFNNPHKCSLYIAAGLPVIAPANSAIGAFVQKENIGIVVNNLNELSNLPHGDAYNLMAANVAAMRLKVINGNYFKSILQIIEKRYAS